MNQDWNPRFVAYADSLGMPPAAALERDREAYPGGRMCGFTLWISERWRAWRSLRGRKRDDVLSEADHADFDSWLAEGHRQGGGQP